MKVSNHTSAYSKPNSPKFLTEVRTSLDSRSLASYKSLTPVKVPPQMQCHSDE